MLADGNEFPCQTLDVSTTGVAIAAYVVANLGERVIAYFDELGRIEGVTVRRGEGWFAIKVATPRGRIDRIAQKIALLSGESAAPAVAPTPPRSAALRTEFGQEFTVRIAEETENGATALADFKLLPGVRVTLDGRRAVVRGDSADGIFVEFERTAD